ncbi:MAG: hypothetical protein M1826_006944 [Phylliscum demangeonii]|nr:MAG: hypothetical protein M1826_006944 [Phylliscum demangeonii]
MHFSTLTLTAAVTASCLLTSAWSLPEPRVLSSNQQGLLTSAEPAVDSAAGNAAIPRLLHQKRDIKAKFDARKLPLAKKLWRDFANTPDPISSMIVARRPLAPTYSEGAEQQQQQQQQTTEKGQASSEAGPLRYARQQAERAGHALHLSSFHPARIFPAMFGSKAHRATEERAAAMRAVAPAFETLKKDMRFERGL